MNERIAITLDGRPLEVNHISQLPRERVVGLLIDLATLQGAIAAQLFSGSSMSGHNANEEPPTSADNGTRVPARSRGIRSSASTVGRDRGMDDAAAASTEGEIDEEIYLDVKGIAARLGMSPSTIYHWIGSGKLDEAHGLRKLGSRRLIDWQVFQGCLERGEFN